MSDLQRFQHPRFARIYERISAEAERRGTTEHRQRLLAGISGRVLELGAGNGLNFAHYPPAVTEVVAVEPDDSLRRRAEQAAQNAPVSIRVIAGHADQLPVDDASVDVVVASLVLCSVPDQASALAEIRRVLVSGGQLRYYEHVRDSGLRGVLEEAITPVWSKVGGGCHPNRRTSHAIAVAGLQIDQEERFGFRPVRLSLRYEHVIGIAREPGIPVR
jgi:ubiquinone/menaquinone biosynthesis C-methylase UbiE